MSAQQGERMAPERQAQAGVIGNDVLPLARRQQRGTPLASRRIERRTALRTRRGPMREAPMAGYGQQGPGRREAAQLLAVELQRCYGGVRPACPAASSPRPPQPPPPAPAAA